MKKVTLILFALLFSVLQISAQAPNYFSLGFADSVRSDILKEQRPLLVYTPYQGKRSRSSSKDRYPVLYVLDGENNFRSVAIMVERLADMGLCPQMIVVGIPNTDRSRDLTPTTVANNSDGVKNSGGGEQFLAFIEKELIPNIDSNYPTAPYKLLMGHSLGGLMVVHTMAHHKDLFNGYIAIEPSIWWDGHKVLNEAKAAIEKDFYSHKTLFLAIGNHMERGVDTTAVQADKSDQTELTRYNLELIHHIHKHAETQLRFAEAYYPNDNHGTIPFIAAYDALRFIFDYYKLNIYNSELADPTFKLDSLLITHYKNISEQIGYLIKPEESQVNGLGYYMLSQKQFIKAEALFKLNITNYPETANCYDGLGDLYLAKGDKEKAIESFKKTLTLKLIPETKAKLEKLLKETK